jgi:Rod binding domain-containing protein
MKINNDFSNMPSGVKVKNSQENGTAKEFEAMFMQMMLKEMHPKMESNGILGPSKSEEMFHQIMDETIARDMVETGQTKLGLQEALAREYFQN